MFSCTAPFEDPTPENVVTLIDKMLSRINLEDFHSQLNPTEYEKSPKHLKRFLEKHFMDLEVALNTWHTWVEWRHENNVDNITDREVQYEMKEGIFAWRGKDKENRKCMVITGRMLDPINRKGTPLSFKKFLIRTIEQGLKEADEADQEQICIIYDRRDLDFQHIDPNLYQFCKKAIEELRTFYGDRIGKIYVLHTNWFFWILYKIIVKPFLGLWDGGDKLLVIEKAEDLLEYFDADQLFLLSVGEEGSGNAIEEGKDEQGEDGNENMNVMVTEESETKTDQREYISQQPTINTIAREKL